MKKSVIAIVFVVFIAIGGTLALVYVMLDEIIHKGIEIIGPEAAGVSVQVNSASISPFSGNFDLNSLTLGSPQGFRADRSLFVRDIKVRVSMASLLKDVLIIEEVIVDGASVTWEGISGDNHRQIIRNIHAYAERFAKQEDGEKLPPSEKNGETGRNVSIKKVTLKNSSLALVAAGKQLATVPIPDLHLTDIGTGKEGERPGEAIQGTYDQIYAALSRSARGNSRIFRGKLDELGQRGREMLASTGEATSGIREDAAKRLQDIRRGVEKLFK